MFRFRRSMKLAPGVRMNFSRSGISYTFGPRGASIGIGGRGSRSSGARSHSQSSPSTHTSLLAVQIKVADDGLVSFEDSKGNPLSDDLISLAKKQHGDAIHKLIQSKCDDINSQIDALGELHLHTPAPDEKPKFEANTFALKPPGEPVYAPRGLLGLLFGWIRKRIDRENEEKRLRYETELKTYETEKALFQTAEEKRRLFIESEIYTNVQAMERFLEEILQSIVWPRETLVAIDISEDGKRIFLDVDLPEIEDLPRNKASFPQRGYSLTVKEMSAAAIQRLYMQHVHGIGFRIIGETFATLPASDEIVLSAFSQRSDKSTGNVEDQYLYSVRVSRSKWAKINFSRLQFIDVVEAFERFELRRQMTKNGVFKSISPIALDRKD